MENVKASAKKIMINYGVILGLISVVFGVIGYVMDSYLEPNWTLSIIGFIIFIIIVVIGQKSFRKENSGYLSLGQAIKIGLGIALISSLFSVIWQLVLSNVLVTDFAEQALELQRQAIIDSGRDFTPEQMEQSLEFSKNFSKPYITIPLQIIGGLFFGFIISLISGLVLKKENPYEGS